MSEARHAATGWRAASSDPNSTEALARRQAQLDAAWRPAVDDRLTFLLDQCRHQRVLDLGCAGQATQLGDERWLHGHIARVARECVGTDLAESALAPVRAAGFEVVAADVAQTPPASLVERGPFDVVVAGELIEHLARPTDLLDFARPLLDRAGRLVITTPNPFALNRVYLGRARRHRENCDHTVMVFPGGVVEMADRAGYELTEVMTTRLPRRRELIWRGLKAEAWRWRHRDEPRNYWIVPLVHVVAGLQDWRHDNGGETSIYVLRRT